MRWVALQHPVINLDVHAESIIYQIHVQERTILMVATYYNFGLGSKCGSKNMLMDLESRVMKYKIIIQYSAVLISTCIRNVDLGYTSISRRKTAHAS